MALTDERRSTGPTGTVHPSNTTDVAAVSRRAPGTGRPWAAPTVPMVADEFEHLEAAWGLLDRAGTSPDGLVERYLYSPDLTYRYAFGRWWGAPDLVTTDVWVLLNPATGDTEQRRRPTLEKCVARSRAADRSGLLVLNLFAYRHTDPKALRLAEHPVGPANDATLRLLTAAAPRTIAAWGSHGTLQGRSQQVAPLLDRPLCLGTTRHGEPRHPLYVPAATELVPWPPASPSSVG